MPPEMSAPPATATTATTAAPLLPIRGNGAAAILALADGTIFRGVAIGALGHSTGEVVFNTAMTGYQEILTDPSYAGQIVTLTYPHIGNVGVNAEDVESRRPFAAGLVIRDLPRVVSNFRSTADLGAYLATHNVVGIAGIDTRKLTRILRERGAQNGCVCAAPSIGDADVADALARARSAPSMAGLDLAQVVSCTKPYEWTSGGWTLGAGYATPGQARFHVVAYDFGIKHNILRRLVDRHARVTVVPAQTPADAVLALKPDGVFLSNGPGDPEPCDYAIRAIARVRRRRPADVRHLSRSPAARARVRREDEKMKFGHHGANHPVLDRDTGQVLITSQNHGFAVDASTLPANRARDARVAVRRQPAGHRAHRPPGLLLPGPSGGEPRPARHLLSVRPLRKIDGKEGMNCPHVRCAPREPAAPFPRLGEH